MSILGTLIIALIVFLVTYAVGEWLTRDRPARGNRKSDPPRK